MAAPSTTLAPLAEPGGGTTLFPAKRLVAFYGAPGGVGLGVLGQADPEAVWNTLAAQATPYASAGVTVLPAFELITYVAQSHPGDGTYSHRLADSQIQQYLRVVQEHQGMLILDIQPGRGSLLAQAETLTAYLQLPDVALALDPEWEIGPGQVPGQVIGHTTAAEINQVSTWLQQLTVAHHLPQKLLLVHQFTADMIADKTAVGAQPNLAIVFNMDGFGTWTNKVAKYQLLESDPRFPLGFKLFYRQDTPLYPPSSVLALAPAPSVVEYE